MDDMMYAIIGNGSGEAIYDNRLIEVSDEVPSEAVQKWCDEWMVKLRESSPEMVDRFDDLAPDKIALEDIVSQMPPDWNATVTAKQGSCLFF